jgi:hypothetical protein
MEQPLNAHEPGMVTGLIAKVAGTVASGGTTARSSERGPGRTPDRGRRHGSRASCWVTKGVNTLGSATSWL